MASACKTLSLRGRRFGSRVHLHPDEQYPKKQIKCFQKILKKIVDDRVGVANMLDKIHVERSSGVSSAKKNKFGVTF